jgi:hypothetical protein
MKAFEWMKLPADVRHKLVLKYELVRTGFTDVRGNQVISDGFTDKDLEKVEFNNGNVNLEYEREKSEQVEGTDNSGVEEVTGSNKAKRVRKN